MLSRHDEEVLSISVCNDWVGTNSLDIVLVIGSLVAFTTFRVGGAGVFFHARKPGVFPGVAAEAPISCVELCPRFTIRLWQKSYRFTEFTANELTLVGHWVRMCKGAVFCRG